MMNCIKHKIVKARKEYRCEICFGKINKGDLYRNNITTDNREIYNNHICSNCDKLEIFLAEKDYYDFWDEDDLDDCIFDFINDLDSQKDYEDFKKYLNDKYPDDENIQELESREEVDDYCEVNPRQLLLRYLKFIKFEVKE